MGGERGDRQDPGWPSHRAEDSQGPRGHRGDLPQAPRVDVRPCSERAEAISVVTVGASSFVGDGGVPFSSVICVGFTNVGGYASLVAAILDQYSARYMGDIEK